MLDSNHIPSCTSAGSVLQLCKVSQNYNKPFRRSCTYKVHNPPFRESISWIISPSKFQTATVFLQAHLQVVYYNYVKFHKNSIRSLIGVALTRYMPPPFFVKVPVELSPLLNFGQQPYRCVKFRRSCTYKVHGWTDRVIPIFPPKLCLRGV
jgi:hypothetical protein